MIRRLLARLRAADPVEVKTVPLIAFLILFAAACIIPAACSRLLN